MTQASANGGLEILVEASINHDLSSGLIGAKILSFASPEQIVIAREYCRIKHHYTGRQIDAAINSSSGLKEPPPAGNEVNPARRRLSLAPSTT